MLLQSLFEFLGVYVALERQLQLRIFRLVDCTIKSYSLAALYVSFSCVEMRVTGNNCTGCHKVTEQHILGSPTLMGWYNVAEAGQSLYGIFQLEER